MTDIQNEPEIERSLGFLTVQGNIRSGLIGGFLILNRLGHPLEFHCTAPVRPNRAQEVLYGATLEPYLRGRQIASALLHKAKSKCFAVITDSFPALAIQKTLSLPLLMIFDADGPTAGGFDALETTRLADFDRSEWRELPPDAKRRDRLAVAAQFWDDPQRRALISAGLDRFYDAIELTEPFERIALAIEESQKG